MGGRSKRHISEAELSRWPLIEQFEQRLERARAATEEPRTFKDPRRKLSQKDYLSLLLLGLFNPVVDSMRGLCAASRLSRVQQQVCSGGVSLGSFSEAQAVIDPALVQRVFAELAAEPIQREGSLLDGRLERYRQGPVSLRTGQTDPTRDAPLLNVVGDDSPTCFQLEGVKRCADSPHSKSTSCEICENAYSRFAELLECARVLASLFKRLLSLASQA